MSYKIEVYVKKGCPYCIQAKNFFKKKLLDFEEIFISNDRSDRLYLEMYTRSGGCVTVPQIFINDQHIGGFDNLLKLHNDDPEKLNFLLYER